MTDVAAVIGGLPYFEDLDPDLLSRVAMGSSAVELAPGEVVIDEGSQPQEMFVVIAGTLAVTKAQPGSVIEVAQLGPGDVVGEMAVLSQAPRSATVSAQTESTVLKISAESVQLLLEDPTVLRNMFLTVTERMRGIEEALRHHERMAALGKMAAQLMHEMNNPAAAIARSSQALADVTSELEDQSDLLAAGMSDLKVARPAPAESMSALQRSEAERDIADLLSEMGVDPIWDVVPALVAEGWDRESIAASVATTDPQFHPGVARWLGLRSAVAQLVGEISLASSRVSDLVRVVKEYSFLDQAPIQTVDLTKGLSDTLVLLKHQLRDIDVQVAIDDDLLPVEAPGRELNQVWTNLIDNAAQAMESGGTLTVSGHNDGPDVVISITDTGDGIPPEVVNKIFDPFFTTKEPGHGTGLGLHTVHTIVQRVGGTITVESGSGGTTFVVRLPSV